jgi:hypothetical protein
MTERGKNQNPCTQKTPHKIKEIVFMRILDTGADKAIKNIILYLRIEEAKELYDSLGTLLKDCDNNHAHIDDESFEHETTVVIYDEQHIELLNERSKKIIMEDI